MTKKKIKATTPTRIRISKSVLDAKDARIKELSELNAKSAKTILEQEKEIASLRHDLDAERKGHADTNQALQIKNKACEEFDKKPKEVSIKLEALKAPSRNLMVNVDVEIIAKTNGIQDLRQLTLAETKKLTFVLKNLFQELKSYGE